MVSLDFPDWLERSDMLSGLNIDYLEASEMIFIIRIVVFLSLIGYFVLQKCPTVLQQSPTELRQTHSSFEKQSSAPTKLTGYQEVWLLRFLVGFRWLPACQMIRILPEPVLNGFCETRSGPVQAELSKKMSQVLGSEHGISQVRHYPMEPGTSIKPIVPYTRHSTRLFWETLNSEKPIVFS